MAPGLLIACCLAVLLGALIQRIAGMGVGLVAAPVLTLLLGPALGVTMSNAAAVVSAAIILVALRRDIDWRRWLQMAPLLLIGTAVGTLAVRELNLAWLDVLVGGSILAALVASVLLRRGPSLQGWPLAMTAGFTAGFMNTTSGVAAPALTAYSLATRWEQRSFAATLQPIFLLTNLASLIAKSAAGAVPVLPPWWVWLAVLASGPAGIIIGRLLARRTPVAVARRLAITIALVAGIIAVVRGLLAL